MAKADVIMKFDAQTAAFIQNVEAARLKLNAATGEALKTGEKLSGLSEKMASFGDRMSKMNFGEAIARELGIPTTPMEMLQTGLSAVGKALEFINAEADRGADSMKRLENPAKSLLQISTDLKNFQDLRGEARSIALSSGMSMEDSMRLQVSARNRGLQKDSAFFGDASRYTAQPAQMVDAVADVQEAYGKKAGAPRQIMNEFLAGSQESKLDLENFSRSTMISAPHMGALGASPQEAMAATASAAGYFGTGEKGGDRLARVAAVFNKHGLSGEGGLLGAYDKFQTFDPAEQKKIGGESMEFAAGMEFIKQRRPQIERVQKQITEAGMATGGFSDLHGQKMQMSEDDPEMSAIRSRNRAKVRRESAEATAFGGRRLRTDAAIDDLAAESVESGEFGPKRFVKQAAAEGVKFLGGSEKAVQDAGENVGGAIDAVRRLFFNATGMGQVNQALDVKIVNTPKGNQAARNGPKFENER